MRRNLPRPAPGLKALIQRPELVVSALILLVTTLVVSASVVWSREQIKVGPGRTMTSSRLARLTFAVPDLARTRAAEQDARDRAPDVYTIDRTAVDALRSPLQNLPVVVAQQEKLENLAADVRTAFALDEASMERLRAYAHESTATEEWTGWVTALLDRELPKYPIVENKDWQRGSVEPEPPRLEAPDRTLVRSWSDAIRLGGEGEGPRDTLMAELRRVVERAGFPRTVSPYVVAGIASNARPTYVKNNGLTDVLAEHRAELVAPIEDRLNKGDVIYARGDVLNEAQLHDLRNEIAAFRTQAPLLDVWLPRLGLAGLITLLIAFAGGFILRGYPRIRRNHVRLFAICLLMAGMLGVTVVLTSEIPQLLLPVAIAPTLFVAIIVLLSYDQRLALFLATVQCAVVALALDGGLGLFVLLLAGCAAMVGQLREVRNRSSLISAGIVGAATLGVGTIMLGFFTAPAIQGIWGQILSDSAWAVAAGLGVGFLVLGILPSVERAFDITTGMTLAELRDPSQPLLRQLQQRAPGTYNHSLQVANIAEAAADAIGADGLLLYVGALYHDIGKMNKPDYFVENQAGGYNKHAKLRPAMSLLVIIGHVKDGIELAREYSLPRSILHFIESHHGTTLVEYFYHAAREEAQVDEKASVAEIEFRYPGPKPRTKEGAILMLADSVESATRAMTEPNPGRIEGLVRELSRRRLLDGQFDECELTFRELGLIEDAIIARVCAIHHGRISYPSAKVEVEEVA